MARSIDAIIALLFVSGFLAVVLGGFARVLWVFLFDENIGVAGPPPGRRLPPAGFDVVIGTKPPATRTPGTAEVEVEGRAPDRNSA